MGKPGSRLGDEARLERQAGVYRRYTRGLSLRDIAKELDIDLTSAHRALQQARSAIRKQKGAEYLADLAQELTDGSRDDLANSWEDAKLAEDHIYIDPRGEVHPYRDFKAIAIERGVRSTLRRDIARFNGLDKIDVQIDVSPRLQAAFTQATQEYVEALKAQRGPG